MHTSHTGFLNEKKKNFQLDTYRVGGSKFFMGGRQLIAKKEFSKITKNYQNLLNKSPKDGGADAPPAPPSSAPPG